MPEEEGTPKASDDVSTGHLWESPAEAAARPEGLSTQLQEAPAKKAEPVPDGGSAGVSAEAWKRAVAALDDGRPEDALAEVFRDRAKDFQLPGAQWARYKDRVKRDKLAVTRAHEEAATKQAKLDEYSRALAPLISAREAYENGDYAEAFKQAFGEDINEYQRKVLRQVKGEDPRVTKLERELRREREERAEREQAIAARVSEEQRRARITAHVNSLAETLKASENPAISQAANIQEFVGHVFAIQKEAYDPSTGETIDAEEAAEEALNRMREIHKKWHFLGSAAETKAEGGQVPEPVGQRAKPVKRLRQTGASEATVPKPRSREEAIAAYARAMKDATDD